MLYALDTYPCELNLTQDQIKNQLSIGIPLTLIEPFKFNFKKMFIVVLVQLYNFVSTIQNIYNIFKFNKLIIV